MVKAKQKSTGAKLPDGFSVGPGGTITIDPSKFDVFKVTEDNASGFGGSKVIAYKARPVVRVRAGQRVTYVTSGC